MLRSSRTWLSKNSSVSDSIARRSVSSNDGNVNGSGTIDSRLRIWSHCPTKSFIHRVARGSASSLRVSRARTAGSDNRPRSAASSSSSSGMLRQRKKASRDASSRSLMRWSASAPVSTGRASLRIRNAGMLSSASSARAMPVSKSPSARPTS